MSCACEPGLDNALVVLAGKPGTGKTTLGRLLASRLRAAYLRCDVIAGPMLLGGLTADSARAGCVAYDVACGVATENLQVGVPVVVDGVHATHALRLLWRRVSEISHARLIQLEIMLSDEVEHRRRVRDREATAFAGPTWEQIRDMDYDEWNDAIDGRRLAVDAHDTDRALMRCLTHVTGPDRG